MQTRATAGATMTSAIILALASTSCAPGSSSQESHQRQSEPDRRAGAPVTPGSQRSPTNANRDSPGPTPGLLTDRIGRYLTIEGTRDDSGKTGTRTLLVDVVIYKPDPERQPQNVVHQILNPPVSIWIDNIDALPGASPGSAGENRDTSPRATPDPSKPPRITLKGYESARYIGMPEEVARATGRRPQAVWQLQRYFIATSVESPAGIELKY